MSSSAAWLLSAVALVALSAGLIGLNASGGAIPAGGAVTGLITVLLWSWWRRDRLRAPRPMSEYVAVGYVLAFYTALLFTWSETGGKWSDWLLMLPPLSWLPPTLAALSVAFTGRRLESGTMRRLHRLIATGYAVAVAFFVVSVLAIVVSPVPLLAVLLHLAAARFYGRAQLNT